MENPEGKMNRFCSFLVRHRLAFLLIILGITAVFCYGATKISSEMLLYELFPYEHPYPRLNAKFAKIFGTGAASAAISVKVKDGDISNPQPLNKIKEMTREMELLKTNIYFSPALRGKLVSYDFTAALIAPIVVGLISTFIGLGFAGFTGINFTWLIYVLAFLVGARA